MSQPSKAVEQMRSDLRYAGRYRERANAADRLYGLLNCETPGTISEVAVKGRRWFRRHQTRASEVEEVVLSDDERREFAAWCKERAEKLNKQADEIETRYANPDPTGAAQ